MIWDIPEITLVYPITMSKQKRYSRDKYGISLDNLVYLGLTTDNLGLTTDDHG